MRPMQRTAATLAGIVLGLAAQACIASGGGGSGGGGGNGLPGGVTPTDATGDAASATDSGTPLDTTGGGDGATTGDSATGGDSATAGGDAAQPADAQAGDGTVQPEVTLVDSVVNDTVQDSGSDSGKTDSGGGEIGPPKDTKDADVFFPDSSEVGPGDVNTDAFGSQSCCTTSNKPGCIDPNVAMCVCAQDSYCCSTKWDSQCAGEVSQFGCGFCPGGPDGGSSDGGTSDVFVDSGKTDAFDGGKTDASDGGMSDVGDGGSTDVFNPGSNSCCEASSSPGCVDPAVMQCVCAFDPFCCQTAWDSICVAGVTKKGCGICAGSGADGGGSGPDAGF